MGDLRLDNDGARIFTEWRTQRCKSEDDARLVGEVLETVSARGWQRRWFYYRDDSQPGITSIVPREGLHVHVRLWTDEVNQFTIASISDVPPEEEPD